ncbi:hypothetical protein EDM52_08775 [Brevibacillus invocatus]|uniref:Uncharacterized protein n=1 Tax=Brevibacillus invocatus TaxID=173959 RepID=A0A3M8CGR0_9BACL|nr:hypothetical protein [Brevibacillus invocatus]RNB74809.1 hypothetical protein EDM52_08775 [Brevibacillus invocatus]
MVKNRFSINATILVLSLGLMFFTANLITAKANNEEKIISYPGHVIPYDDLRELEKDSPIIVQASFTGERETVYPNITEGKLFRSDSLVEIHNVFKGDLENQDKIIVYEPAIIDEDNNYVTIDGYKLMDENGTYTLLLKPVKNKEGYAISGMYQGKYNNNIQKNGKNVTRSLDYEALSEVDYFGENIDHFKRLKEKVVEKYEVLSD